MKTFEEFFYELNPDVPKGNWGVPGEQMVSMQKRYYGTASKFFDYIASEMMSRNVTVSSDKPIVIDPNALKLAIEEYERQEREKPHKKLCVDMDDDYGAAIEPSVFRNQIKPPGEE